jgi:hypothetical protein
VASRVRGDRHPAIRPLHFRSDGGAALISQRICLCLSVRFRFRQGGSVPSCESHTDCRTCDEKSLLRQTSWALPLACCEAAKPKLKFEIGTLLTIKLGQKRFKYGQYPTEAA